MAPYQVGNLHFTVKKKLLLAKTFSDMTKKDHNNKFYFAPKKIH
jgi:hypothetical protein